MTKGLFNRLQNRLVLAFVLVLLIPALLTSIYSAIRTSQVLSESVAQAESERAQAQADDVEDALVAVNSDLLFISQQPAIRRFVNSASLSRTIEAEVTRFLEEFLARAEAQYKGACLLDATGMETVCVNNEAGETVIVPDEALANRRTEAYFSRVISLTSLPGSQAPVYVGELQLVQANGEVIRPFQPTIPYSTLLLSDLGAIGGVLVLQTLAQPLFDLLVSDATNEQVLLVDADGNYLMHPDESKLYGATLGTNANFEADFPNDAIEILHQSQGVLFGSEDNPGTVQTFQRIRPDGQASIQWTAIYQQPLDVVFQPVTQTTLVTIGITVVSLLVAIGIAVVITRGISRPVTQLANAAESISRGEWQTPLPQLKSRDEIGTLINSFSKMVTDLQTRADELLKANALEKEQREKLDAALQEAQELNEAMERVNLELEDAVRTSDEATRLKSEFVANMSHELRTPLNAIHGFCGIMLEGMGGEIDDEARHMLRRIDSNSDRLLKLINDILDIAKIEAGRMEVVREILKPQTLAEHWRNQMSVLAETKKLDFKVNLDPALPETLIGDSGLITQIVTNLLSNAFKFTKEGSVQLDLLRHDTQWQIVVTDTGAGIPPHALNFIFDEFRQVDGSSRRVYGGTGLGLAIVRNICRIMEGSIKVSSQLGKGSVFTVTLPLQLPADAEVRMSTKKIAVPEAVLS
ncbi:MAG: ATP-binding protein [Chloroflexota bacterium]|nr:ATP-binding protein [Chloroflexota bacterium]